jgi:hypothetical protein
MQDPGCQLRIRPLLVLRSSKALLINEWSNRRAQKERPCRSWYALVHPEMPRRGTRSYIWPEAAMLPQTGSQELESSL